MNVSPSISPTIERLVAYLVDGAAPDPALAGLPVWLAETPRFRAFAEANRDKIRKKLRHATDEPARLDVRAELRVAALLLADRRFELEFEAYGSGRRGPDFTVTFRAGRPFNVEVTRRRPVHGPASLEPSVIAKLRQLPPSTANVLLIAVDGHGAAPDPGPVMHELRLRADRHEDALFGDGGAVEFRAGLQRLAAVVTWAESGEGAEPAAEPTTAATAAKIAYWLNANARVALPDATLRALVAALAP